jgi:hypothetical protein
MRNSRNQGSERGAAVIVVLLFAVLITLGAVAALTGLENRRAEVSGYRSERDRAFPLAESGVHQIAVLVNANAWTPTSQLDWAADALDNDGDGDVDEGDESLFATAEIWANDGIDNDGDTEIDEQDEKMGRVACAVELGRTTRGITGWIRRLSVLLPEPVAAVYLDNPSAGVNFSGNAFEVDGRDQNLNGTPGPESPLLGIATNGPTGPVTSALGAQQSNNVGGAGGTPSVGSSPPPGPNFISEMIEAFRPGASIVFNNYPGTYTGNLGEATPGNFVITYSQGDLQIGGGSTGAGVLLVDGDLTISGGWDYVGWVFVSGDVNMVGGGGGKRLRGALFVGGSFNVTGTVDLIYSSEALQTVEEELFPYRVYGITEP